MTGYVFVIGDPVEHSLSPDMHNAAFAHLGLDLRYLRFQVPRERLGNAVRGLKGLGIVGANVTTPLKRDIIKYLDRLAPSAAESGAVNTVVAESGELVGHNTDGKGAISALEEATSLDGRSVVVLGAGGTATAICHALAPRDVSLLILNRTLSNAEELATSLNPARGVETGSLLDREAVRRVHACDVVVNATTVGMGEDRSPLPSDAFHPGMTVLDCVYNPLHTRLLREAEDAGAVTVPGTRMLIHQGAESFRLWTGKPASLEVMEGGLVRALERRGEL